MIGLTYRKLSDVDFKVLKMLEGGMARFEYVPLEWLERRWRGRVSYLHNSISKLNRLKIVRRRLSPYLGYELTWRGYDLLALRSLVEMDILEALGDIIGVGKESQVYSGLTPGGKRVIVKIHRVGRTSFKQTARFRTYRSVRDLRSWIEESITAAEREYRALEELLKVEGSVPKPIGRSRHVVVTEYVDGALLYKIGDLKNPVRVLEETIDTVKKAYWEVGIVHGDLSEYNVMVEFGSEKPYIIDWPQYVYKDHPSALKLLERDVKYLTRYFNKRYRVNLDYKALLEYVLENR